MMLAGAAAFESAARDGLEWQHHSDASDNSDDIIGALALAGPVSQAARHPDSGGLADRSPSRRSPVEPGGGAGRNPKPKISCLVEPGSPSAARPGITRARAPLLQARASQ